MHSHLLSNAFPALCRSVSQLQNHINLSLLHWSFRSFLFALVTSTVCRRCQALYLAAKKSWITLIVRSTIFSKSAFVTLYAGANSTWSPDLPSTVPVPG